MISKSNSVRLDGKLRPVGSGVSETRLRAALSQNGIEWHSMGLMVDRRCHIICTEIIWAYGHPADSASRHDPRSDCDRLGGHLRSSMLTVGWKVSIVSTVDLLQETRVRNVFYWKSISSYRPLIGLKLFLILNGRGESLCEREFRKSSSEICPLVTECLVLKSFQWKVFSEKFTLKTDSNFRP